MRCGNGLVKRENARNVSLQHLALAFQSTHFVIKESEMQSDTIVSDALVTPQTRTALALWSRSNEVKLLSLGRDQQIGQAEGLFWSGGILVFDPSIVRETREDVRQQVTRLIGQASDKALNGLTRARRQSPAE